jgi:hypothetical protein
MTDPKKPGVAFWATVVVITALSAYVGGYGLTVRPCPFINVHGTSAIPGPHLFLRSAEYGRELPFIGYIWMDENLRQLFTPIQWIDRRLRPDTWYVELHF